MNELFGSGSADMTGWKIAVVAGLVVFGLIVIVCGEMGGAQPSSKTNYSELAGWRLVAMRPYEFREFAVFEKDGELTAWFRDAGEWYRYPGGEPCEMTPTEDDFGALVESVERLRGIGDDGPHQGEWTKEDIECFRQGVWPYSLAGLASPAPLKEAAP
jgi:hypothetical protein